MMRLFIRVAPVLALAAAMLLGADWLARRYLHSRLTEHAAGPDAAAVLPDLAELAEQAPIGVEPLAEAAASTHRPTALAAREEIGGLLRMWSLAESERPGLSRDPLRKELATALLVRSHRFTPAGQQWLASVAIRLVKESGADPDLNLTLVCDSLLSASRRRAEILDAAPPMPVADTASPQLRSARPPSPSPSPPPVFTPPQPRTVRLTGPPKPPADTPEPRPLAAAPAARRIAAVPVAVKPAGRPDAGLAWQRPAGVSPAAVPGRTGWGPSPMVSTLGASVALVASLPDRLVLHAGLQHPDRLTHAAIVARGFGRSSREELATAVAGTPADRTQLAERLGGNQSAAAARLLLLLAGDPAPLVRRAAILQLGESGSPALERAAIKIAIRDPDPRVAALADEILRR